MPPWMDSHNHSADPCLRRAAYAGARHRYGEELPEAVVERLEHELRRYRPNGLFGLFSGGTRHRVAQPAHLRTGIGRRLSGGLLPGHHQRLPGKAQPVLRPIPQSRPHGSAGHRRGFCLGRAGHGHRRRAGPFCRPCRHGGQPYPVPAPHGRCGKRPRFWHARCRDRQNHPAAALVLAFGANWMRACSDLQQRPETRPWISFTPGRRSSPWPSESSASPATSPSIPAGWSLPRIPSDTMSLSKSAPKGVPIIQWDKDGRRGCRPGQDRSSGQPQPGGDPGRWPTSVKTALTFDEYGWEPEDDPTPGIPWPGAAPWAVFTSRARPCACCTAKPVWATSTTW
jgi:hypothetical protein